MRCDLRDCRLAALSLVASWLMMDVIHGVTLETEHWKKVRKIRTRGRNPLELFQRQLQDTGLAAVHRHFRISNPPLHVPFDNHNLLSLSYPGSRNHCVLVGPFSSCSFHQQRIFAAT